jgi:Sporulation and spore germination
LTAVVAWGRRAGGLAVALATVSAGLSGCGLGAESHPQALDPKSVPYGLLSRTGVSRAAAHGDVVKVAMYLEGRDEHLVLSYGYVSRPATVSGVLQALATGPTTAQANRGLVSPASAVGRFGPGPIRGGVVAINLPVSFENLDGEGQTVAAAQIVFTVTNFPGIEGVTFLMGGQAVHVPNDVGKLISGPLTRKDYAALAS